MRSAIRLCNSDKCSKTNSPINEKSMTEKVLNGIDVESVHDESLRKIIQNLQIKSKKHL